MALVVFTWDLPPGERVAVYNETVRTAWVPSVLQQPGVTAVRGIGIPTR
jgi:hypothetical protein